MFALDIGLTTSVLECVEAVASDLDRLLEEDGCQGIHRDVETKRD